MENKAGLYTIQNLITANGQGMGGYGPTIILDAEVVQAMVQNKTRRVEEAPLVGMLKANLINSLGEDFEHTVRINYYKDSWLLTGMTLEGMNCACFHLDGGTISQLDSSDFENVRYNSHNIDNAHHGAVIVSTWLLWFNTIIGITNFEQPFKM